MKKNTIKTANLILERRYLKQKSLIVESENPPINDKEYINILKKNGFTLKPYTTELKPYTTDMDWKYENDKTQVYTYKLKSDKLKSDKLKSEDVYMGQGLFYNPKSDLTISSSIIRFRLPITSENGVTWDKLMSEYIQSKNIYDPSWSLEKVKEQIENINLTLTDMKVGQIDKFEGMFIRTFKGVQYNINKWLVDPDKTLANDELIKAKKLAKEKGLKIT